MNLSRIESLLKNFSSKKILVIGDLILDEFIWGKVSRISPEAPVPVVEVSSESSYPGGAANVARNLREFGCEVHVMGIIGKDLQGEKLKSLLQQQQIQLDCLTEDSAAPTIVKTRIIARHQQVVRVDREKKTVLSAEQKSAALAKLKEILPSIDAVIFEDYGKGLLDQDLVDQLTRVAKEAGKIVTVDPNPRNPLTWHTTTTVKPNRLEAYAAAGKSCDDPVEPPLSDESLLQVGKILSEKWDAEMLLITLGEQGMLLFERNAAPFHIPTRAQEVFDVSGAGDTAIALFTLALCAGATSAEAAEISNHASGIVVGKLGTATVSPHELLESFHNHASE